MAVKFSAFTTRTGTLDASTKIVGYDDPAGTKTNVEFSLATLAANSGIYSADGTIGTTRIAKVTDTVTFQNAGGTSSLFSLNTDGTFTLGHGATNAAGSSSVAIGISASTVAQFSVAIGRQAVVSSGMSSYSTVVGNQAASLGGQSVSIGSYSGASSSSVAIGHSAGGAGYPAINIGHSSKGTGNNAITLNVSGATAAPSTQYQFGVYMTSNTTPDFEVVGGGDSTLNTNLKITGQGYTELYDTANITLTVDWDNSNIQEITSLTGAHVFTASNPKIGATYILTLGQTGAVTPTWTGVKWPAATAPTLSGAGKTDIITLVCYDATGAGLYYGSSTLNFTT